MTHRPWIKVCGITRPEDARMAASAGVHALGIILVPDSPRTVSRVRLAELLAEIPEGIARVAVTTNQTPTELHRVLEGLPFTAIQAHGEESPEMLREYELPTVKAIPTRPGMTVADLEPYAAWPLLLDGFKPGHRGGSGQPANSDLAQGARRAGFRVLLAGGLNSGNVLAAVEAVQPIAVDFNSGVEDAPGIKNSHAVHSAVAALAALNPPEARSWPW